VLDRLECRLWRSSVLKKKIEEDKIIIQRMLNKSKLRDYRSPINTAPFFGFFVCPRFSLLFFFRNPPMTILNYRLRFFHCFPLRRHHCPNGHCRLLHLPTIPNLHRQHSYRLLRWNLRRAVVSLLFPPIVCNDVVFRIP
jgi:hypothetical protein